MCARAAGVAVWRTRDADLRTESRLTSYSAVRRGGVLRSKGLSENMPVPPPPPPPPAPAPPPPPTHLYRSSEGPVRNALLADIQKGARLKKVGQVNDRSAPVIDKPKGDTSSGGPGGPAPSLGGLFAGGFPALRPPGQRDAASRSGCTPGLRKPLWSPPLLFTETGEIIPETFLSDFKGRMAPPPAPPARSPNTELSSRTPPPAPPPPLPSSLRNGHMHILDDFESKFQFHPIDDFPPPEEFKPFPRIYPSKAARESSKPLGLGLRTRMR
ncbi:hypothetical protein SKAU_G00407660 [Synaphobranchus kaupii]|uniref:WH2 domain-containing protein n=1 Tax=Synaphobranchus kaupii TaxID=118154 RepID=A0A9Q1EAA9_SYNKA|nr:hypothetical protein SKAU_G00407660 [Synaphobranchus kaupii]